MKSLLSKCFENILLILYFSILSAIYLIKILSSFCISSRLSDFFSHFNITFLTVIKIPNFIKKAEKLFGNLGLEKAKIQTELTDNKYFDKFGKEKIQFLFQANTGFPLKPIQSAISGGERSRVMLVIKKIMAENEDLPTLILDEIDSGVSGKTADEIGKVMKDMAKNLQLIVITHHAQVASKGDQHHKVIKQDIDGKTQSNIITLTAEQRLQEIAQILSGSNITEAALQQAKELINN